MERQTTTPEWTSVAEVELVYRTKIKPSQRPKITCSRDCYEVLKTVYDTDTLELMEQSKVLLLNHANRVLGVYQICIGNLDNVIMDFRRIFAAALKANAAGIIVSHNHPSGKLKPSPSDLAFTRRLKEAGNLLDIQVLDHVILSSEGYLSLADEGEL